MLYLLPDHIKHAPGEGGGASLSTCQEEIIQGVYKVLFTNITIETWLWVLINNRYELSGT